MVYHVAIRWATTPSTFVFNLDEETLQRRFIEPWEQGNAIVAKGRQYNAGYWRLEIIAGEAASDRGDPITTWINLSSQSDDVTDDFVTVPFGSERAAPTQPSASPPAPPPQTAVNPRNVMVVHGRDLGLRDSMFALLRALDLAPLEWSQLVSLTGEGTPYVGRVLERAFEVAQAAVVLFSPDDEARLSERLWRDGEAAEETEYRGQARPNVFFEAGLAFGLFPSKTLLVEVGSLRPASDLAGRHVVRLDDSPERRQELAQRLEDAGCPIDRSGTDWLRSGSFGEPTGQP